MPNEKGDGAWLQDLMKSQELISASVQLLWRKSQSLMALLELQTDQGKQQDELTFLVFKLSQEIKEVLRCFRGIADIFGEAAQSQQDVEKLEHKALMDALRATFEACEKDRREHQQKLSGGA